MRYLFHLHSSTTQPLHPQALDLKAYLPKIPTSATHPYLTKKMDSWTYTQFKTSRDFVYSYIHLPPTQGRGYILFLHGFPSSARDWRHQILYFHRKGFGIVAPDLLGYGSTSKPLDLGSYTGKGMSQDVREILKHEAIDTAIGVGHDWYERISQKENACVLIFCQGVISTLPLSQLLPFTFL
jgi:pimeloyl-ACP methyl ester carboxylesterase